MKKHICRQCGSTFEYCRGCLLSPIPYKDAGFCSKDCYEDSKNKIVPTVAIEPVVEEIEIVEIEKPIVEDENESLTEVIQPVDEEVSIEILADAETPLETITATESIIKNETYNAYKKKKKKHK